MNKHIILTVTLLLLETWCLAHPAQNDREEKNLQGKVKTLTDISDYGSRDTYSFDQDGCLVHAVFDSGEPISYDYKMEKDAKGRILRIIEFNATGDTTSTTDYAYDKSGTLISSHFYSANRSSNYKHYWNKQEQRTKVEKLFDDDEMEEYYTYEYDKKGFLTKIISIYIDGSLVDTQLFENDKYGNPTSIKTYDADGLLLDQLIITYEYDKQGNYVKQVTSSGIEDANYYSMERVIEYYK